MKEDAKNIREPNKAGMPQVPKWEKLRRKLKCQKCKYSGNGVVYKYILTCECNKNPKRLSQCSKRFGLIKLAIYILTCIPIVKIFSIAFQKTENFFLSATIMLCFACLFDLVMLTLEALGKNFFDYLEKARRKEYEKEMKKIEEIKEEGIRIKEEKHAAEERKAEDIKNANLQYKKFEKLNDNKIIEKLFQKEFKDVLTQMESLCEVITPESFSSDQLRYLFKMYLPEVLTVCEDFIVKYESETLSEEDKKIQEIKNLLIKIADNLGEIRQKIIDKDNLELWIRIVALNESFKVKKDAENKEEENAEC